MDPPRERTIQGNGLSKRIDRPVEQTLQREWRSKRRGSVRERTLQRKQASQGTNPRAFPPPWQAWELMCACDAVAACEHAPVRPHPLQCAPPSSGLPSMCPLQCALPSVRSLQHMAMAHVHPGAASNPMRRTHAHMHTCPSDAREYMSMPCGGCIRSHVTHVFMHARVHSNVRGPTPVASRTHASMHSDSRNHIHARHDYVRSMIICRAW
eukprot:354786-Chlamydomonas_euryale.AAC.3